MSALAKHQTLVWKNLMIMKRHWKSVVFEIFFPVALVILFTWLFREYGRDQDDASHMFTLYSNSSGFENCYISRSVVRKIMYSPPGPWFDSFVQESFKITGFYRYDPIEFVSVRNAQALDDYLNNKPASEPAVGIQFDDLLAGITDRPNVLNFTLRFPNIGSETGVHDCFDNFQYQLEKTFIGPNDLPEVSVYGFYYAQSSSDFLNSVLKVLLPIVIILSTLYSVNRIIKNVAHERECQLKETMRIMGLSSALHWMSWFTMSLWLFFISFALVLVFLKYKIIVSLAFLPNVNLMAFWIVLTSYNIAVITFCFLMSVIFKKANTAGNVGTIIFMVTFIFFYQFRDNFGDMNYIMKMLYCLPINTSLGQVFEMILQLDLSSNGLDFTNMATRVDGFNFSVLEMVMMFFIISVIQMSLTIYIEQVFTGDIGVAKPWYFPVAPIVRIFKSDKETFENSGSTVSASVYEPDPTNLKKGIEIVNMSKNFGSATVVNNLNLNMYEDQITVLLGHNGAGKTTTMNMLTGMFSPSHGTAFLNGHDITTETDAARSSLGLCPQHNILFDDLTVGEHITFFCKMKGVTSKKAIKAEIEKFADLLGFKDKVNALSKTLSGGQKRKLSIGVALCGNSKIVMLDEPTSGLDAGARRDLWNLLIQEKQGRTILLSTHYMDEADVLGDRIAIMNEGELQTVGSSFFLKRRFGSGYKFICVKHQGFQVNDVLNVLKEFAPDAKLESNAQTEAVFVINEENLPNFHRMFKKIEDEQEKLNISSFGCSLTTLEEVFIKVGSQVDNTKTTHSKENLDFNDFVPTRKVSGQKLFWYQVLAMILKKFHYTRRNLYSIGWLTLITIGLSYALLAAPTEFNFDLYGEFRDPEEISMRQFKSTVTPLEHYATQDAFADAFTSFFTGKDRVEQIAENHTEFIFKKFRGSIVNTFNTFPIGTSVLNDEIIAWYHDDSSYSHLTKLVSLHYVLRAILKAVVGSDSDIFVFNRQFNQSIYYEPEETTGEFTDVSETTDIAPVESSSLIEDFYKQAAKAEGDEDEEVLSPEKAMTFDSVIINFILIFLLFFIVLAYWPSVIIAMKVKERVNRSKLLQFISGVNRYIYWFTSFCLDYILLLVVGFIVIGVVALNQRAYFRTGEHIGVMMTIFAVYGFTTVPFVYAFSFMFTKDSTAETMVPVTGLFLGLLFVLYAVLGLVMEMFLLPDIIYWVGLFFGPFNLIDCFRKYAVGSFKAVENDLEHVYFDFNENGLNSNIIMMLASGVVYISFCLMADHLLFHRMFYKIANRSPPSKASMTSDEDVVAETKKIKMMDQSDLQSANLVLTGLSKSYSSNLAVNQLHLGVDSSECFGLLGVNGAGKSSTFKMMTGDELISSGDVWIRGSSMRNEMMKAQKIVGYCPQFDALMFEISGRECLKIFSLIRGIPRDEIDGIIVKLATELGFQMHLDKKINAYSGGNKRKISTALSLIGDPSLIFLDEPTTGIDPYSKRQLWTIINKVRNSGKSVVLTSHSMEECEALCTRIAIMVAGEFKCLGSAQHLKNKFSKGFILTIKMKSDDKASLDEVRNKIHADFPLTHLKEKYLDLLTFHINSADLKWSEVFAKMSQLKSALTINDFSVTQMSLEEVFLHFTREGTETAMNGLDP